MRKRYKKKRRSCPLCKPHKLGLEKRWKNKDLARLEEFEREQLEIRKNGTGNE